MITIIIFLLSVYALWYVFHAMPYYLGTYYKNKKRPFLLTFFDKGAYGEYLVYDRLRCYESDGARFLFNCYLPAKNGETSEIDVLMIHPAGIYVFESKNYSGWIFGSEKYPTWTQCLPQGRGRSRKEKFYNPVMQNRTHVKWLINLIGSRDVIRNVVVFSERCVLKDVEVDSRDVIVIRRDSLRRIVHLSFNVSSYRMSNERVAELYDKLLPFTQVNEEARAAHVRKVSEKYKK